MIASIKYDTYTITEVGEKFLNNEEDGAVLLPGLEMPSCENLSKAEKKESNQPKTSHLRRRKGGHALTVVQQLMSVKENWYPISTSDDYNFEFPGVFKHLYPQRLGYCEDNTKLPNYEVTDPHFIFSDIQLGKGKA